MDTSWIRLNGGDPPQLYEIDPNEENYEGVDELIASIVIIGVFFATILAGGAVLARRLVR